VIQKELLKVNERIRRTNRNAFIFTIIGVFLIAITQFYNIIEKGYAFNEFIIVIELFGNFSFRTTLLKNAVL
jgi:hypothetical protein